MKTKAKISFRANYRELIRQAFLGLCTTRRVLAAYYIISSKWTSIKRPNEHLENPALESRLPPSPSVRVRGKISSLANKWDDAGPDKLGKVNERTSKRLLASWNTSWWNRRTRQVVQKGGENYSTTLVTRKHYPRGVRQINERLVPSKYARLDAPQSNQRLRITLSPSYLLPLLSTFLPLSSLFDFQFIEQTRPPPSSVDKA